MRKFYSLFFALAITSMAFGQTVNTFTKSSGNFKTAGNWSEGNVPKAGEMAEIPSGRTAYLNSDFSGTGIKLKVSGTLQLNDNDLTISTNNAYIQISGNGKIVGDNSRWSRGRIRVNGNTVFNGGKLSGTQFLNATDGYMWVSGTLPIGIKDFSASVNYNNVRIVWSLNKNVVNKTFTIERSNNGKNWIKVTEIVVDEKEQYSYDDNSSYSGINYYRLKSLGIDGSVSYSSIKVVHVGISNTSLKVFPNPAVRTLNVYVNAGTEQKKISAVLVNRNGQVVAQKMLAASNGMIEFGVTHLAEGNYTLNLKGENGYNESRSVIISRK